jgi:hypothetical protein
MKKCLLYLLICTMGVTAQAYVIDDFEDTSLAEYTITPILQNGGPDTYQVQSPAGSLEIVTTVNSAEDQYAIIYNGLSLPVGAEVQIDIVHNGGNQDIGLYVGGTAPVAVTRFDYVAMYARVDGTNHQLFTRGFDGSTEYGLIGNWGDNVYDKLFIKNVDGATFEMGWYNGTTRTVLGTRTPTYTNAATYVGLYADIRATGTLGHADNLAIVTEPYAPSVDQVQDTSNGTVDATLKWNAAVDPSGTYDVDPEIVDQYVFISGGIADPNLYYAGATAVDESAWSLMDPRTTRVITGL